MTGSSIEAKDGSYNVDWGAVYNIIASSNRASCAADQARIVSTNESRWYNPFSWQLPTIKTVDVDWETCRTMGNHNAEREVELYKKNFYNHSQDIANEVARREALISLKTNELSRKMHSASEYNRTSIEQSVEGYDVGIGVTKFVRDASASTLILGSTFVVPGAALPLLGTGSALTGYAKYQDTGKPWAGVIAGSGAMAIGYFSIAGKGLKLAASEKVYFAIGKGAVDMGAGIVGGDSLDGALRSGGATIITDVISNSIFGTKLAKDTFRRMPMPVKIVQGRRAPSHWFSNKESRPGDREGRVEIRQRQSLESRD